MGDLDRAVAREKQTRRDAAARAWEAGPPPADGEQRWPLGFSMTDDGLFAQVDDGAPPTWLCAPFELLGEARDPKGEAWSKWLRWHDADGREHTLPVPDRLLHLATGEPEAMLADLGLRISPDPKLRGLLRRALNGVRSGNRVSLVRGAGWKTLRDGSHAYVLQDGTVFGGGGEKLVLHPKAENADLMAGAAGTLEGWQTEVAAAAEGNAPGVFCASAGFAGPLLEATGETSGGIQLFGRSKSGKTLAAQVGLSAWCLPFKQAGLRSWASTANNMEAAAEEATDGLLLLDEIGQADPREVARAIYLLGNEGGKGRLRADATAKARRSWRVFILSTGEHDTASVVAAVGQKLPAGADVRLPSIKTTAENTWPELHGHATSARLAETLLGAMRRHHGTAGPAFVARLIQERATNPDGLVAGLRTMREKFAEALAADADPQVHDVARRFALVAYAGWLGVRWGILPWAEDAPLRAAQDMLDRWLEQRGGQGSGEEDRHVQAIRLFLIENSLLRFITLYREGGSQSAKWLERLPDRPVAQRAGWRRPVEITGDDRYEHVIPQDVWQAECAKLGFDPIETARTLHARGFLDPGEGKNLAKKVRMPGVGTIRAYVVKADLLGDAVPEGGA